jgi:hypothetical protein
VRFRLVVLAAVAAIVAGQSMAAAADTNPQPIDFSHNVLSAPAPDSSAQFGTAPKVKTGTAFCTTVTSAAANVNTDCAQATVGPHNETSIAVNPKDPMNMIGGANDYQLTLNPDGHVSETILSQAHVTFDGGKTWANYPVISDASYQATGDPALAFDANGHAYYATLGFRFVGPGNALSPDVLVSNSGDGGKTWSVVRVASGSGVFSSVGDLLDKEYIAAWGGGNAIVTFTDFLQDQRGGFVSATVHDSVTHDGGQSWSGLNDISGGLSEASFTTPVMTADGRLFVSFTNTTDLTTGRDDYEIVEVDPATGARISGPKKVATIIDGATDYPVAFGRQTYHDSVFRNGDPVSLAADPTNGAHLAAVWSDERNSPLPANPNPYAAVTNSDVIVSESFDHGQTWSAATAIQRDRDQFMPWAVFDTSGRLRIGFFDRFYDVNNQMYGYTVATETSFSPLTFSFQEVSTALSDPTKGDRWFSRTTFNSAFPHPTAFMGDYSNIAATPDGGVVAFWTDMRNSISFGVRTGSGQDAYFAKTT